MDNLVSCLLGSNHQVCLMIAKSIHKMSISDTIKYIAAWTGVNESMSKDSCSVVKVVQADPERPRHRPGTILEEPPKKLLSLVTPDHILHNPELNRLISAWLPRNYNFEVHKTIWTIQRNEYKRVVLQMPEGLQRWAMPLSDLLSTFAGCTVVVMAEQTYGACCIDDMQAQSLGCDFIIHYGHSCLIPVSEMLVKAMYVFVEIDFDHQHLVETIIDNFQLESKIALVGTIQFNSVLHKAYSELKGRGFSNVFVPQSKPLSSGEILGCTAPRLSPHTSCIIYIGDGRFHLESIMLSNPQCSAFRYDPYNKRMTTEGYDHASMRAARASAISAAASASIIGIAISALGRQASPKIIEDLKGKLVAAGKRVKMVMMPEIKPEVLALLTGVDAWVQIACPRLSIDWGYAFDKPVLSPYELNVALGLTQLPEDHYPMDYYAYNPGGPWSNYYWKKK